MCLPKIPQGEEVLNFAIPQENTNLMIFTDLGIKRYKVLDISYFGFGNEVLFFKEMLSDGKIKYHRVIIGQNGVISFLIRG